MVEKPGVKKLVGYKQRWRRLREREEKLGVKYRVGKTGKGKVYEKTEGRKDLVGNYLGVKTAG